MTTSKCAKLQAIRYHGNDTWTLYLSSQQRYVVSDVLTAGAILGITTSPKALKALGKLFAATRIEQLFTLTQRS
jgi:hypothetical protein